MAELDINEFKKLHEAAKTQKRLNALLIDEEECDEEILEMYVLDELDRKSSTAMQQHLQHCDHCQRKVTELKGYAEAVEVALSEGTEEPVENVRKRSVSKKKDASREMRKGSAISGL